MAILIAGRRRPAVPGSPSAAGPAPLRACCIRIMSRGAIGSCPRTTITLRKALSRSPSAVGLERALAEERGPQQPPRTLDADDSARAGWPACRPQSDRHLQTSSVPNSPSGSVARAAESGGLGGDLRAHLVPDAALPRRGERPQLDRTRASPASRTGRRRLRRRPAAAARCPRSPATSEPAEVDPASSLVVDVVSSRPTGPAGRLRVASAPRARRRRAASPPVRLGALSAELRRALRRNSCLLPVVGLTARRVVLTQTPPVEPYPPAPRADSAAARPRRTGPARPAGRPAGRSGRRGAARPARARSWLTSSTLISPR